MRTASILSLAFLGLTSGTVYFKEEFNDDPFSSGRWIESNWKQSEGSKGKFELSHGELFGDAKRDQGLRTSQDSRFYTASAAFPSFTNKDKTLVFQYQVKNEQNIECGGSYLKLGPKISDQSKFTGDTPYSIMFGPDQCGSATKKTHVIFSYKGKNLDRKKDVEQRSDNLSHLYTLVVKPDNTYSVKIDQAEVAKGNLLDDWNFLAPKTIKDPSVSKPKDWVDEKEIDDPSDIKPNDWVNEKTITDPDAKKPDDWDDEEDGEWTAPVIENPAYKGDWKAKRIPNPAYKGEWVHPEIPNPAYEDDQHVYAYPDISQVAIDEWQVKAGTIFDNIFVGDDEKEAEEFANQTWKPLSEAEKKQKDAKDKAAADAAKRAEESKAVPAEDAEDEDSEGHDGEL